MTRANPIIMLLLISCKMMILPFEFFGLEPHFSKMMLRCIYPIRQPVWPSFGQNATKQRHRTYGLGLSETGKIWAKREDDTCTLETGAKRNWHDAKQEIRNFRYIRWFIQSWVFTFTYNVNRYSTYLKAKNAMVNFFLQNANLQPINLVIF